MFDAVKRALIAALNAVIEFLGAAINTLISLWPIGMPNLPSLPEEASMVLAWLMWSPLPIAAGVALFLFLITVELLWWAAAPILRWAKAID